MSATKPKHRRTKHATQLPLKSLESRIQAVTKSMIRKDLPNFKAGDTVRVQVKIKEGDKERLQAYEGLVIARQNRGASKSFTVRKISHGVGVERVFLESSPKVAKVEIIQEGKVRRAKLYYIRKLAGKAAKIDRDMDAQTAEATPANKG